MGLGDSLGAALVEIDNPIIGAAIFIPTTIFFYFAVMRHYKRTIGTSEADLPIALIRLIFGLIMLVLLLGLARQLLAQL